MPVIKKIAVANRGEIAKRIISTCQEMGLNTVLLYAGGDIHNEAFRLSDEQICIGPSDPLSSYLNITANIEGAKSTTTAALKAVEGTTIGVMDSNGKVLKRSTRK